MAYKLSKTIFSKETVLKVIYLWQGILIIDITEDEHNWILNVQPSQNGNEFDFDSFNKQLQEQQLRETLNNQFGSLRDSIYSRAFQHFQG